MRKPHALPLLLGGLLAAAPLSPLWAQKAAAKPAAKPGAAASAATAAQAESAVADRAEVDTTQIIGNRELPKVLYIVPWKRPVPPPLSGKPPASVMDEALAPLDRDVFRRQVAYGVATAPGAAASASPKP